MNRSRPSSRSHPVLRVACAIVRRRGRILAARRRHGLRALKWEFPGGKIGPRERIRDCIVREIREELDIRVRPLIVHRAVRHRYPDRTIRLIPVTCRHAGGRLRLREHTAALWIQPSRIMDLDWAAADRKVIRQLRLDREAPSVGRRQAQHS